MTKAWNWAATIALAIFVAGAVALEAQPSGWLSHFTNQSSGVVQFRAHSQYGMPVMVGFGTAVPTVANDGSPPRDGELFIVLAASTAPDLQIYDSNGSAWNSIAGVDLNAQTWVAAQTFTAAATFNGNVVLGNNEDDLVTVNAPVVYRVIREDFEGPYGVWDVTNGDMVGSLADDEPNIMKFQNMDIWYEHEVVYTGTLTESTFINTGTAADAEGRVWLLDNAAILDGTDDDALELVFGGPEIDGGEMFIEEATDSLDAYCEISIRIGDFSDIGANDFYFGWFLNTAINDTFAYESNNTWAAFSVLDTSGDLSIGTDINAGGSPAEDDAGVTLEDNTTYVLRVEIGADAVAFYVDGTAVTQSNAVLDAEATDQFVCRMGIRMLGATLPTYELNYVEIGKEQ